MKIPTANVIVGLNREVMDRLFSEGATYTSLIGGLKEEEGALLFENQANPNFISFEHSNNFGGGFKMTLVLLDPKGELESKLLTDSPLANIAGTSRTHKGDTKESNKDLERSNANLDDKYFAELAQEYAEHLGDKEFFIAYGSGENLELWAGPHKVTLQSSNIDMKGAKKITLVFVASPQLLDIRQRKGAYNEEINLNLAGLTTRYSGHSKPIKISTNIPYVPLDYLELGESVNALVKKNIEDQSNELLSLDFNHLASEIGTFDFHSIIIDTIRSYVQKATNNPNVIVLLPNLNITCRQRLNSLIATSKCENEFLTDLANNPTPNLSDVDQNYLATLNWQEYFLGRLLADFGMELVSTRKLDIASLVKAIPIGAINKYLSVEKAKSEKEREEFYYEDNLFYCKLQEASDVGIPDHKSVLDKVMKRIAKYSKGVVPLTPVYVNETSTKLLNFWSKGTGTVEPFKFPLFGGYTDFNETQEAVIVGDKSLVADYLYGDSNISKSYENIKEAKKKRTKEAFEATLPAPFKELITSSTFAARRSKRIAHTDFILGQIPLHPLDKLIVGSIDYNKQVRALLYPSLESSKGSFGDTSYLPDNFAFRDTFISQKEKDLIIEHSIPTFRFNTENPNVLDMRFKFGSIYFAALRIGYIKKVTTKASLVASGILPEGIGSLPLRERGANIAYQKIKNFSLGLGDQERQEFLAKLARKNGEDLEAVDIDPERASDIIDTYLNELAKDPLLGFVEIDQELGGDPHSILTDFMEEMYRNALQMSVKTLPLFHLSNYSTISKGSCLLFAQDTPILQGIQTKRSNINNFYSGYYAIIGFKHTISSGASESEFKLVKQTRNSKKTANA